MDIGISLGGPFAVQRKERWAKAKGSEKEAKKEDKEQWLTKSFALPQKRRKRARRAQCIPLFSGVAREEDPQANKETGARLGTG
jgi:hypothetical protein